MRRDKEMLAVADMLVLPVAILNHGHTVKFTELSFLANVFGPAAILLSVSSMICRPMRQS